jgi:hypothetical protein
MFKGLKMITEENKQKEINKLIAKQYETPEDLIHQIKISLEIFGALSLDNSDLEYSLYIHIEKIKNMLDVLNIKIP